MPQTPTPPPPLAATPSKKSLFGGGKKKSAKADEEAAAANEREIASRVQAELANQKDWMRQRIASLETALEDALAFKLEVKKRERAIREASSAAIERARRAATAEVRAAREKVRCVPYTGPHTTPFAW
jgi:hypothetical protein